MRIGLSLSGGGIRATVFHLGVLARLARQSLLEKITFLSTVSGGSLAVALVWGCSDKLWPGSDLFLRQTMSISRQLLTSRSLKLAYLRSILLPPSTPFHGRAAALAKGLQRCWSVGGLLSDLPDNPRWIINATCYETGKNWRMMKTRMGDYLTGYVAAPQLPIAQAVAASSAVPGLIGPLRLDSGKFDWYTYNDAQTPVPQTARFRTLTLWDGGIYDNLGVEALFKPGGGYRDGFDFLIVSDASAELEDDTRRIRAPLRLLDVATDQIRSLRARSVVAHLQRNPSTGAYLKAGNTAQRIFQEANQICMADHLARNSLGASDVREAAKIGTTLRKITSREFDLLIAHGYQVTDATLSAYCRNEFDARPLNVQCSAMPI